ncbi:MAG: DUF2075 domain-containing protein [Lentisphaeria bacterium]|nr:DUF2075 domain-containing protein [Lentisphaeria bacterium]
MRRAYYQNKVSEFLMDSADVIMGRLAQINEFDLDLNQRDAWQKEIDLLKEALLKPEFASGTILLEYTIPRLCGRIDAILLLNGVVFVVEFKVGERTYPKEAIKQVLEYCLDLKYFHQASENLELVPVLVCTKAEDSDILDYSAYFETIYKPILCASGSKLQEALYHFSVSKPRKEINAEEWMQSIYSPTPTIIEAARALYANHSVADISRTNDDSRATNLTHTTEALNSIIDNTIARKEKAICFLTGVPGAGKTLVGLNIAIQRRGDVDPSERAVFLSGNVPLVRVLQKALYDDASAKREKIKELLKERGEENRIPELVENYRDQAIEKTFVMDIFGFRKEYLDNSPPSCKIAIFDESQRAWTRQRMHNKLSKRYPRINISEPEALIDQMDKNEDWAVIVCLVGGGQEIHNGEAGIIEWFRALNRKFKTWKVYVSDYLEQHPENFEINDSQDESFSKLTDEFACLKSCSRTAIIPSLHLNVSQRSFRSEKVSCLADCIVNGDISGAKNLLQEIQIVYPIVLTRNLETAKKWIKQQAKQINGSSPERYGILASSGALRLRAEGITIPKEDMDICAWMLGDESNVNSSYYMEIAASEFKIQGLEIDYAVVAWEGDYRYKDGGFSFHKFRGSNWQNVNNLTQRDYLKNSYRVLLTRARQGFAIYVPYGSQEDATRPSHHYDGTFQLLKNMGIPEI